MGARTAVAARSVMRASATSRSSIAIRSRAVAYMFWSRSLMPTSWLSSAVTSSCGSAALAARSASQAIS
ncbi:MAG: hypothetical protein E6G00_04095 [Actinobacteria bacterium]|nr:MAG: hypothetical protein E6G00_04095 [Actinomycetota bacterium]